MAPSVLEKIPDQVGYLVMNQDGAVISSGGELENEEKTASVIFQLIKTADKPFLLQQNSSETFKRMSLTYEDHVYSVCISNRKINVVKKKYISTKPVTT